MTANIAVGNAASHPNSAVGPAFHGFPLGILHFGTLADDFKNPGFVGIDDGEGFAFAMIAVGIKQLAHHLDGLTCILSTLKRDVNQ